ncbi:MAG: hypothetical protein L0Z50_34885, partial [Verrucomicrobiales bacterium]|nr:hypothetical protein [Verrucomicrobiales bacterium]
KGNDGPVTDVEEERFTEENLRTFPTDEDIPKDALNNVIDQSFVPAAKVSLPASGEFESWRAKLLRQLRESSFRTFPERIPPADKAPRPDEYRFVDWEREAGVQVWNTESGLLTSSTLHGLKSNEPPRHRPVTLLVVNEEESISELPEWSAAFIAQDEPYVILAPRGVGLTAWTREPAHYIERAHQFIGRTIDQGRVWDIASVGRRLNGDGPIRVIGRGQAGILGAYAALFESAIQEVVAVDPPASHADGPIFLNVLRVLDIPEALGMLAPRPLTLVNAGDPAFKRTKQIYDRAGGKLVLK